MPTLTARNLAERLRPECRAAELRALAWLRHSRRARLRLGQRLRASLLTAHLDAVDGPLVRALTQIVQRARIALRGPLLSINNHGWNVCGMAAPWAAVIQAAPLSELAVLCGRALTERLDLGYADIIAPIFYLLDKIGLRRIWSTYPRIARNIVQELFRVVTAYNLVYP